MGRGDFQIRSQIKKMHILFCPIDLKWQSKDNNSIKIFLRFNRAILKMLVVHFDVQKTKDINW